MAGASGPVGFGSLPVQFRSPVPQPLRKLPEGFPPLRLDLPLLPGYTVTIEPGVYFVPALLADPDMRERHRDAIHWERAEAMLGFGGIRIEDNVLVTDAAPEVLTADVPV